MQKKIVALGGALLLVGLVSAQAVPPKKPNPKPAQKKSQSTKPAAKPLNLYSKVPFDPSMNKVPGNFKGHDLFSLAFSLAGKFKSKGEFETTEVYNKRIEATMAEPVFEGMTANSMLTAVIDLSSGSEYSDLKYNADAGVLAVNKDMEDVPYAFGDYDSRKAQRVLSTGFGFDKVLGSYTGQNAYGTKKRILEKEGYTCDLILLNPKDLGFQRKEYDFMGQNVDFFVNMNPEVAARVVKNLKLLVLFQVAPPFVGTDKDYHSPTINNPLELTTHKFYIFAKVAGVWLYDSKTGEIFAKLPEVEG